VIKYLHHLCMLNGVSGGENSVRDYIISQIGGKCDVSVDVLGNIIAFKKGEQTAKQKLMIAAHMDEVGFIVTSVKGDGTLLFENVGGIEPCAALGKRVQVNGLTGVIGSNPIHKLSKEEREKLPKFADMHIDIGASNKAEAEKYVKLGDYACFEPNFADFSDGKIIAKSLDDRAGCAVLMSLIDDAIPYDAYFVFTVQEELGFRGAKTAAYAVNPDIAFVVEATTAADINGVSDEKRVCLLNEGAAVSFMDKRTVYDKGLYNMTFDAARENNIKCQTKTAIAGGNDSGAIHISRNGVRTLAVSLPCRYLHSPSCVISKNDLTSAFDLIKLMIRKVNEL